MSKIDMTIEKALTIKNKEFENIRPSVSITVKNVDEKTVWSKYKKISQLASAMLALEVLDLNEETSTINNMGFKKYCEGLEGNRIQIESAIKNHKG